MNTSILTTLLCVINFFAPGIPALSSELIDCERCIVLCEQSQNRILIVEAGSKAVKWEWKAKNSNIAREHHAWFDFPDEAKPVYDNKYLLITASGGGVGLIRISDKRAIFYVYAGGNPHSAEILPDGNIVSASSTGNFLKLFNVDTVRGPSEIYSKSYPIIDGHNVVWDKKRKVLWAGSGERLRAYTYNGSCSNPALTLSDSLRLPDNLHDLFPVYGQDALWLTTDTMVYTLDLRKKQFKPATSRHHKSIKSVSSGPAGFPTIIIHPQERWWTDQVSSTAGTNVFSQEGLKIYKARWFVQNAFSYPNGDKLKICP